jgi:dihydroanticapsin dehydrogenase
MRLSGKVAIITGAAQGLGKGIAIRFAQEGAICILADVLGGPLQDTVQTISQFHKNAIGVQTDVSIPEQVDTLIQTAINRYGKIDILVNNAAISFEKRVEYISIEEWKRLMSVNLDSVFLTVKGVFPIMKNQRSGTIVNVASELAFVGYEELSAYTAAKGAIIAFSRSIALEGIHDGIRVNCVCPGAADTPMFWNGVTDPDKIKILLDNVKKEKPGGRLVTPEEVANGVLFLASDESSAVTGTQLIMDLGYTAK